MRNRSLLSSASALAGALLLPFASLRAAPPARPAPAAPAKSVLPYEVHREVLPNGLKVLLIPMPSDGLAAYWTVVRTGSRDEVEPGVTGFAHFFEHMMFRGTKKYPASVYDGIVTSMGASANASTTDDMTIYYLSVTREDLPKVVEIEADRFQNLEYQEPEFKTESGAVYGEYRKGKTSPYFVLTEAIQEKAFTAHTYRHTTIGFEPDIQKMPEQFEYSKGFFRRFYRPENCVVVVAGDFDRKSLMEEIRKKYGPWKAGYVAPKVPVEPAQTAERRLEVSFEGETLPLLALNWKADRFRPEDRIYAAGTLLGELLFGETSELYRKLVLDEQRVESLGTDFSFNRDPGLWSVSSPVKDSGDVKAVEADIRAAVERFRKEPVASARLDAARSRTRYAFLSRLTAPDRVARALARTIAMTGDVTALDRFYATLGQVTPDDVRRAADLYLRPERLTVAVLRSKSEAAASKESPGASPAGAAVRLPVAQDPNVVFKVWVKAGSQDDPPGKEGLAYLTATLIAEGGTRKLSTDQVAAKLFPLAATLSGSVDKEMTVFTGQSHRDVAAAFYPTFAEALVEPGFRPEDFERLKARTLSEIEKELRFSSDEELGKAALTGMVYDGTRYAHLVRGTVAGLAAITLDDVRAFWKARYSRDNVVTAIGGAFDGSLSERLAKDAARLPEGKPEPIPAPKPAKLTGRRVLIVEKPGQSTAISFGYPTDLVRGGREFYALWVASSWLGEHRNSSAQLYKVIRGARGLNYGDYAYIEAFPNGGALMLPPTGVGRRAQMFEVWIRPVPHDRALFSLRAALREVDRLARNGMSKEEFEARKAFLKKYSYQFARTTAERLGYALDDRFYGLGSAAPYGAAEIASAKSSATGAGHLERFRKAMDEVTLEETNAAIRKYLSTDNLAIALVTANGEEMKKALVAGAPSPISYGKSEKPAAVLEEDKEIMSWPLRIEAKDVTVVPVGKMFEK